MNKMFRAGQYIDQQKKVTSNFYEVSENIIFFINLTGIFY